MEECKGCEYWRDDYGCIADGFCVLDDEEDEEE